MEKAKKLKQRLRIVPTDLTRATKQFKSVLQECLEDETPVCGFVIIKFFPDGTTWNHRHGEPRDILGGLEIVKGRVLDSLDIEIL